MKRLFTLLPLLALAACNGDWSINEPYTSVKVSHKGCVMDHGAGGTTNSLVLDIQTTYLPDGRVQCVIQTVNPPKK